MTDRNLPAPITRKAGGSTVQITAAPGQDPAEVEMEIAASFDLLDHLRSQGTEDWHLEYRTFGRLRVAKAKEVGPPPWPIPKVFVKVTRTPLHMTLSAGWRSTCHSVHIVWRSPKRG